MKLSLCTILSTIGLLTLTSLNTNANQSEEVPSPSYNAELAKQLGADQYGMKSYVIVTLTTGPNDDKITDKQQRAELFKGHFSNMSRLADEGKLVLSGPYVEARPKRGLLIFNVASLDEAEKLVKTDPTVEAGIFNFEMSKLYGSAALMQINDIHKTLSKQ